MNFREAYSYDEKTKVWLGPVAGIARAWESPLEEEVFPLPANSTFVKPEPDETQIAIWNGKSWDLIDRTKTKTFWNIQTKQEVTVVDLPAFYPGEGYTDSKPSELVRNEQIEKILSESSEIIAMVSALREKAVRSVMDQIATKKEKDALKKLDAIQAQLTSLNKAADEA